MRTELLFVPDGLYAFWTGQIDAPVLWLPEPRQRNAAVAGDNYLERSATTIVSG
jgi:hypothetical protein